MEGSELIRMCRSIRKYRNEQIPRDALEKIIEAGLSAPNAGGRQGTLIVAVHDRALAEKIGRMNLGKFDRSRLLGSFVSKEQPSAIDDPTIRNGFYGAPTVCAVFAPKHFLFSIPDAFCTAENMVLQAADLGIASCIVSRGEETFDSEEGAALLREWKIPESYIARCFVALGYCDGPYPQPKARKEGRWLIIE